MNNMMYLVGLLIAICLLFQKSTIHLFNSSFIGRIFLFSSVIVAAMYNHLGGLLYGFFLLSILNSAYLENFEQEETPSPKVEEPPVVDKVEPVKKDLLEQEKKITPVSSKDPNNNSVIPLNYDPNENGVIAPSSVVESLLDYSEYNPY